MFPLIQLALNNFYPKLTRRHDSNSQLWINNSIRLDFEWVLSVLEQLSGVILLESFAWDVNDATQTVYCDACPVGMGFWYPASCIGFHSRTPVCGDPSLIFYFEALCIFSAIADAHYAPRMDRGSRLAVYTDNLNTVNIFNTFQALLGTTTFCKRQSISSLTAITHSASCMSLVSKMLLLTPSLWEIFLTPFLSFSTSKS